MMKNDAIEQLFERLKGDLNNQETPENHQNRFLEKLNASQLEKKKSKSWWKPLSIAATILLLVTGGLFIQNTEDAPEGLASVSPEMEQTQSFFVTAINQELETLKSFETNDTKELINQTIHRLSLLEAEYDQLKIDLKESGNDTRVIAAMVANFQSRIELLEQVTETIEEIKTLKANRNETII